MKMTDNRMIEILKKRNRTLLEMHMGMLFFGICCQIAGMPLVEKKADYTLGLWFGIAFAFAASIHMYRTIERAVVSGADASKVAMKGYLFRYGMIALVLIVISVTRVMNPLAVFLGYMSLKVTAYMQPLTHKLCNKLFRETDPVPEALPEEENVPREGEILSE